MKVNSENSQLCHWPPTHVDSATKFIYRGSPSDSASSWLASGTVYIPTPMHYVSLHPHSTCEIKITVLEFSPLDYTFFLV